MSDDCASAAAVAAARTAGESAASRSGRMLALESTTIALATRRSHSSILDRERNSGCAIAIAAHATIPVRSRSRTSSDGRPTRTDAAGDARTNLMLGNGTRGARRVRNR
jgi:hypothetical protein